MIHFNQIEFCEQYSQETHGMAFLLRELFTVHIVEISIGVIQRFVCLLTTKGNNMAAVFMNKFPGDRFLHDLLHLSMTEQMLHDSLINMPQLHTQSL